MKKTISVMSVLIIFLTVAALHAKSYGPKEAETRILIAMEKTKFKNALVNKMLKTLNNGTDYIEVVEHDKKGLDGISSGDYDVVFITGSGVASTVRPWIKKWIAEQDNKDNIILHTTKIYQWKERQPVDTVSSASSTKDAGSLADEYVGLINQKLQK